MGRPAWDGQGEGPLAARVVAGPPPASYAIEASAAEAGRDERGERTMATYVEARTEAARTDAARNPGMPLDLARVEGVRVNRSAVERRAATLPARRTVKKEWQAAWLLRALTCIDLTTLSGDDTPRPLRPPCAQAPPPAPPPPPPPPHR